MSITVRKAIRNKNPPSEETKNVYKIQIQNNADPLRDPGLRRNDHLRHLVHEFQIYGGGDHVPVHECTAG